MADQLILLRTSPRLPAGLLSAPAWDAVRTWPVFAGASSALVEAVRAACVPVTIVSDHTAESVLAATAGAEMAVWLVGPEDADLLDTLSAHVSVSEVTGSWDPPGAHLLDVVSVMDRLRSPGGCPWDAEQTHTSLMPYLMEEAYEAYDALATEDSDALREELGDVLLQVVFHARLASETDWDIDDVASDLVAKLVRRHPHVFEELAVSTVDELHVNWDRIKKAEKSRESSMDGIPRAQPALALAAKYLSRAERAKVPVQTPPLPDAVREPRTDDELGELLFALVAASHRQGLDAEGALRRVADAFADRVRQEEADTSRS